MANGIMHWFNAADPSAAEVATLLKDIDQLLLNLGKKLDTTSAQYEAFIALKKVYEPAKKPLVSTSGELDKDAWANKGRQERGQLFSSFSAIQRSFAGLELPDIRKGRIAFWTLAAVLVFSIAVYLGLHASLPVDIQQPTEASGAVHHSPAATHAEKKTPGAGQATSTARAQTASAANTSISANNPTGAHGAAEPRNGTQRTIDIERQITMLRVALRTEPPGWSKIANAPAVLSNTITHTQVSFHTMKVLGTLEGAVAKQDAPLARNALKDLEVSVDQDLADPPSAYLWTNGALKWIEIGFWALFGVLVGLLYYVSKRLKQGVFNAQDIPTMAAEVVAAPVVACVVFFLFNETGITHISSPAGASMLVILGIAFILGYAIRRTIGLLDGLKTRILPDP